MRKQKPLRWLRCITMVVVVLTIQVGAESNVFAQNLVDEAVQSGREAFRESGNFPWYDAENDQVVRIDVEPPDELENRHSRWEMQPINWRWPPWLSGLLEILFWCLTLALLAYLIFIMVRAFTNREMKAGGGHVSVRTVRQGEADRVESLPFPLERPRTNLLDEARRLYEEGRYAEAIVYLYSYQLVRLDEHKIIRLTRGKTNRQYLRESRRAPSIQPILEKTMVSFEDVFFGNHGLDRNRFESCWNLLDSFHQNLEASAA